MERPWCELEWCGTHLTHQGRPPKGAVTVKVAGSHKTEVFRYCSPIHAARALQSATNPLLDTAPDVAPPRLLQAVNELAGTHLTVQTATLRRVRAALDRAAGRVLADLEAWQDRQDRHRPTLAQVQTEAVTGRVLAEPDDDVPEEPLAEEAATP